MPEPDPRMRRPSLRIILACLLGFLLVLLSYSVLWSFAVIHSQYALADSITVTIEKGMPPGQILSLLREHHLVRHRRLLHLYLRFTKRGEAIQAGEYRFDSPTSEYLVLKKLWEGDVLLHTITIPEGLTMGETAERFIEKGFGTMEGFEQAFRRADLLHGMTNEATTLEGYLAPETYRIPRSMGSEKIVQLLVNRFQEVLPPTIVPEAKRHGLSLHQAVTMASLIEEETAQAAERSVIASVFYNRLARQMRLQCDPTVIFALKRSGRFQGKLRKADLDFDSPYNTYRYHGLPPGPISSPGRASLEAAVDPANTRFLFFVARADGSHHFSITLAEHNRAVRQHQILPGR